MLQGRWASKVLVGALVGALVAPGVATTAAASGDDGPVGAPDTATAPADAEILSPYLRRWRNPDGSWSLESFSGRRFFRDALGVWREIDARLVADEVAGLLRGAALPDTAARLAARLESGAPLARLGGVGGEVTVSLPDAAATDGVVAGDGYTVTYPGALPGGRDVVAELHDVGFKDAVVVPEPGAGASYRVAMDLPSGWSLRDGSAAGVELIDEAGVVAATYGAGAYAFDANHRPARTGVSVAVVDAAAATVEVAVDEAWLYDEARVYPVTVDPTWITVLDEDKQPCPAEPTSYDACDTWVDMGSPDASRHLDSQLWTGMRDGNPAKLARTLLQFPTDDYGTTPARRYHVTSATVELSSDYGPDNARDYDLAGLAAAPSSATTWNNQPAIDTAGVVQRLSIVHESPMESVNFDIASLAQRWFDGDPNLGMRIAAADETDPDTALRFKPGHRDPSENAPRLVIVYVDWPGAPADVTATAGDSQVDVSWTAATAGGGTIGEYRVAVIEHDTGTVVRTDTVCGTCTAHTVTGLSNGTLYRFEVSATNETGQGPVGVSNTARPNLPADPPVLVGPTDGAALATSPSALQVTYADPDGHPGTASFELQTIEGAPVASGSSSTTTSGATASYPLPVLDDGNYRWRARNSDQWGDASAWSGWWSFDVDTTAPVTASLGSPTHPDDTGWYTATDPVFTWTASDTSGMAGFSWTLDRVEDTVPDTQPEAVDPDGDPDDDSYSTSYDGVDDGDWWFHVRGRNRAGLWGEAVHFRIGIDVGAPTPPDIASASHPDQSAWYPADDVEATFTASAISGVIGYSYHLDTQPLTPADETIDTLVGSASADDLPDGEHWLHVRAKSTIGVWGGTSHYRFGIDDTPPPTPPIASSSHPVEAAWYPVADAVMDWTTTDTAPIVGYSTVVDQTATTVPDETVDTSEHTSTLEGLPDGTHWVHVRARNAAGLWTPTAGTGHYRLNVDTTPPPAPAIVSASHPDQSAWYPLDDVAVTWTSSDISGIVGYSWTLDTSPGTVPDTVPDPAPAGGTLTDLADGIHHLHVRAVNGAGLVSDTAHYTLRIDDTPPGSPTIASTSHSSTSTWYAKDDISTSWSAADTAPIVEYRYVLDHSSGTVPGTSATHTSSNGRLFLNTPDGEWWLHVRARNAAGLWSTTTHRRIRIDTTPPKLTSLTSSTHPDQTRWYIARHATLDWTYSDTHSGTNGYSYVIDRNPGTTPDTSVETSSGTTSYSGLDYGRWWFHVAARDTAGNWSAAAHYQLRVVPRCAAGGKIAINQPANITYVTGDYRLIGVAPEGGLTVYVYRDEGNGTFGASDPLVGTVGLPPDATLFEADLPIDAGPNCFFVRARRADGSNPFGTSAVPVLFGGDGITSGGGGGGIVTGEDGSEDEEATTEPDQLAIKMLSVATGIDDLGLEFVNSSPIFPGADDAILSRWWYVQVDPAELDTVATALSLNPLVQTVEPVLIVRGAQATTVPPNDPHYDASIGGFRPQTDYLDDIEAAAGWTATSGGAGGRPIAIIDSGVLYDDPASGNPWINDDLDGKLIEQYDCVTHGGNCTATDNPAGDVANHGTAVAGVAAAETNNANGVAGVGYHNRFNSYRVTYNSDGNSETGRCRSLVAGNFCFAPEAIRLAASRGDGVINLSLFTGPLNRDFAQPDRDGWPDHWQDVINHAGRRGAAVVSIAGNPRSGDVGDAFWPGRGHGVVAVGGTDIDAPRARAGVYGNFQSNEAADWVDLAAPSTAITSTFAEPNVAGPADVNLVDEAAGTSFAAPQVAGATALLTSTTFSSWRRHPLRAVHRITSSVNPFTTTTLDGLGRGLLDVEAAATTRAVRLDGMDRFETAVEVSRERFPGSVVAGVLLPDAVVLTVGEDAAGAPRFADALAASGLASVHSAPVLLVNEDHSRWLNTPASVVRSEIDRTLGCPTPAGTSPPAGRGPLVYIVGGEAVVPASTLNALSDCFDADADITRIAGATRYHTAVAAAEAIVDRPGAPTFFEVALTSGEGYADAMVMSAWAAADRAPLVLTPQAGLHPATDAFLRDNRSRITRVWLAGGTAALSSAVAVQAADAVGDANKLERIAGATRYQTATAVAERLFSGHRGVLLATGQNWPDGIAASSASRIGLSTGSAWPLLLTTSPPLGDRLGPVLHTAVRDYLANNTAIDHGYVLGGLAPVGRRSFNDLNGRL